jgi:hypothetical protein
LEFAVVAGAPQDDRAALTRDIGKLLERAGFPDSWLTL